MEHYHGSTHYHLPWNTKTRFPYSTSMINPAAAACEEEAGLIGVSWPTRSYRCNFCGRDFRSAQALGGHMNVHRRDRAKLNQKGHDFNITPKPQPSAGNGDNSVETRLSVGINYNYGSGTAVICKRSQKKEWGFMEEDGANIDLELRLGDSPMFK